MIPGLLRGLRLTALLLPVCLAGCAPTRTEPPAGEKLNVLLISIDTLRADHLGCYGYSRPTSPNIDAFAKESVRFATAITQAPWTTPSHMTLLTSLYPSSHGVNRSFRDLFESKDARTMRVLAPAQVTLAEALRDAGYETLALTGGATLAPELGFNQGFDEYVVGTQKVSEENWDRLAKWFDRDRSKPFFLFFHTFEVHAPYANPEMATDLLTESQRSGMDAAIRAATVSYQASQKQYLEANELYRPEVTSALYDGGIRSVDRFLGRLFDDLRRRGLYDRTLIVLLSDHGEEFGEHDPRRFFDAHCTTQYEELVHVPLLIRHPGLASRPRVVARPVGLIDVAPTILEELGIEAPRRWQGESLGSLLVRDRDDLPWVVSSATCSGPAIKAWREDRYKYIATFEVSADGERSFIPGKVLREELYDLEQDPAERFDIGGVESELMHLKRALLYRHYDMLKAWERAGESAHAQPTSKLEKELRALGYL